MPELPEVETVRRVLCSKIVGKTIINIDIVYSNIIEDEDQFFINSLVNKKFSDVKRCGKVLIFEVEDVYFISHLRMEGKYFIKSNTQPIVKHEHVIFHLDDGTDLRYHDVRKFGKMTIRTKENLYTTSPLLDLGYEPFNSLMTPDLLLKRINKKLPIKSLLLDQNIMSGLGNIYVDEVLFKCQINPLTLGKFITLHQARIIIENSAAILAKAIEFGGTTIRSYTSSLGVTGHYQDFLLVHTKEDEKCQICKNIILKTKVGGRGTYYCPNCQGEALTK